MPVPCRGPATVPPKGNRITVGENLVTWLLGYPGILGSISQAERREVAHKGSYPQPVEKIGYFIPFGEGSLKMHFHIHVLQ